MAYSQKDPQWANIKLGTSNYTIGSGGCYITAFCNVLAQYGVNINPKQMNEKLLKEGRYTGDGGDVEGRTLTNMYPEIQYVQGYSWANSENIDIGALSIQDKPGYEGIVGLDYQLNVAGIQTHFNRLRGTVDGLVVIDDSIDGSRVVVQSRYGKQSLAVCYLDLYYKKPAVVPVIPPVIPPVDPVVALNDKIKSLTVQLEAEADKTLKQGVRLVELSNQNADLVKENDTLSVTLAGYEKEIVNLEAEIAALKGTANKWTVLKQLIKELFNKE